MRRPNPVHSAALQILPLIAIAVASARLLAQTETAPLPKFEVAAIKPSAPGSHGGGLKANPGGQTFVAEHMSLRQLIKYAYKISDSELVGGPDWVDTFPFDLQMKSDRPTNRTELPLLIQDLLADRFQLHFRRETRTLPALILTVDKGGSRMTPNDGPDQWAISIQGTGGGPPPKPPKWAGTRCSMKYLTYWIAQQEDRPVIDRTGLPGFYDFKLEYAPDLAVRGIKGPNGEPPPFFDGPTLFTALREQLGLKLESMKGPVEVYVIDHAAKPAEN
jgi:uncharacterized protein (TIGR03435 family)